MIPPREPVDRTLVALIDANLDHPVGLVDAPPESAGDPPDTPFLLVAPIFGTSLRGTQRDPDSIVGFAYDLIGVGERSDQAQALVDAALTIVVGRTGHGFDYPWPDTPAPVRRTSDGYGPPQRSESGRSWSVSAQVTVVVG